MIRRALAALRSLAGNGRPDDLCALIDAPAEPAPGLRISDITMDWLFEPTPHPLTRTALANLRDTLADWHDEVWALADIELAEMTREGR